MVVGWSGESCFRFCDSQNLNQVKLQTGVDSAITWFFNLFFGMRFRTRFCGFCK